MYQDGYPFGLDTASPSTEDTTILDIEDTASPATGDTPLFSLVALSSDMAPASNEGQFNFLISCIRYSNNAKLKIQYLRHPLPKSVSARARSWNVGRQYHVSGMRELSSMRVRKSTSARAKVTPSMSSTSAPVNWMSGPDPSRSLTLTLKGEECMRVIIQRVWQLRWKRSTTSGRTSVWMSMEDVNID